MYSICRLIPNLYTHMSVSLFAISLWVSNKYFKYNLSKMGILIFPHNLTSPSHNSVLLKLETWESTVILITKSHLFFFWNISQFTSSSFYVHCQHPGLCYIISGLDDCLRSLAPLSRSILAPPKGIFLVASLSMAPNQLPLRTQI